jgi:hypothetical protein
MVQIAKSKTTSFVLRQPIIRRYQKPNTTIPRSSNHCPIVALTHISERLVAQAQVEGSVACALPVWRLHGLSLRSVPF